MSRIAFIVVIVIIFASAGELFAAPSPINSSLVWTPSDRVWGPECAYGGNEPECRYVEMRKNGATDSAIAFADKWYKRTGKIACLTRFQDMGVVDLAEVTTPTYNDPNTSSYILVNGTTEITQLWDLVRNISIKKGEQYRVLVKKFPNMEIWPQHEFAGHQKLPGGGQKFIFDFLLLNGCRACDVSGSAEFAFSFDRAGKFRGARLVRLIPPQ